MGYTLEIINVVNNTSEPVYAFKNFWRKFEFTPVEDILKIPFQDFNLIDFNFVKNVNEALLTRENVFLRASYPDANKRTEINFTSNTKEVSLTYYFPNGNKKIF